jgi:hypothetical protein
MSSRISSRSSRSLYMASSTVECSTHGRTTSDGLQVPFIAQDGVGYTTGPSPIAKFHPFAQSYQQCGYIRHGASRNGNIP